MESVQGVPPHHCAGELGLLRLPSALRGTAPLHWQARAIAFTERLARDQIHLR